MSSREALVRNQSVRARRTELSGSYAFFGNAASVSLQIPFEDTFTGIVQAISRLEERGAVELLVDLATLLRQAGDPCGFQIRIQSKTPFFEETVRGISFLPYPEAPIPEGIGLSNWGLVIRSPHFPGGLRQLETVAFEPIRDGMEELVCVTMPNRLIRRMPESEVYEAAWHLQDVLSRQMSYS